MRHVTPADIAALPTLADVEASLKPAHRPVITAARASIEGAYGNFETAIPDNLHTLAPVGLSQATRKTLETIFTLRLGEFGTLWEALHEHFEDTGNSTCPYCNFGEQWEHDHYLPKSLFPEFTLYPNNLVPICKGCNGKKRALYHLAGARLFTYVFSELDGVVGLLNVEIAYAPKLGVSYSLVNPGTLAPATFEVLERHFRALDLGRRYTKQTSTTLALLLRTFRTPVSLGLGPRQLRHRLKQMAVDRAAQCPANHWEVALLQRLAASSDFTNYVFS
jgi:hypothetical protein